MAAALGSVLVRSNSFKLRSKAEREIPGDPPAASAPMEEAAVPDEVGTVDPVALAALATARGCPGGRVYGVPAAAAAAHGS